MILITAICAQLFSLLVGIVSYNKKSISFSGLLALLLISSSLLWMDKIAFLFILFFMFASSSLLTRFKKSVKKEFEEVVARSGPRNYIQALANLGVATALAHIYHLYSFEIFVAAFIGSVAAGNADSWASEIGGLAKGHPVLITNFKPVRKGISGGITWLGTLGGIAGSLFISLSSLALFYWLHPLKSDYYSIFWSSFLAGILGLLLDSYLGALVQVLYKNSSDGQPTEDKTKGNQLIKGIHWVNNDMVNFLATLGGAGFGAGLYFIFQY